MRIKKSPILAALTAAIVMFSFSTIPAYARTISNTINASYIVDKSIFYVSTAAEYNEAYSGAVDGDKIVVLDGKTIEFNSEISIEKSIILAAEAKGKSGVSFNAPQARLILKNDNVCIEGLNFSKSQDGEIILVTSPKSALIKENTFKGNGNNSGITICSLSTEASAGKSIDITGNTFDTLLNGVSVETGRNINIKSNIFSNIGKGVNAGGAVTVDSDSDYEHISSIIIDGNTIDTSNLCYWKNSKLGTNGNITTPGWFDSNINIINNTSGGKAVDTMDAANPLLLTMVSGTSVNNVTAGSMTDISFRADVASQHLRLAGVEYVMKWATADGSLSTMSMIYKDAPITSNNGGLFVISADAGISGTYTVKAKFNKRGTYKLDIYAQMP